MARADGSKAVAAIVESDVVFHRSLVSAVESPRLDRAHEQIMGEAQLAIVHDKVLLTSRSAGIAPEHETILDAVREGNVALSRHLLEAHLRGVSRRLSPLG